MGQVANSLVTPATSDKELLPLENARNRLAALWLPVVGIILLVVYIQALLGKYVDASGDNSPKVWGWLAPTVMPTALMIVSVLGLTALQARFSNSVVQKSFFWVAFWSSAFYLALVLIVILIQPFVPKSDPIELMHRSSLFLGTVQGLVASALGVLFITKEKKPEIEPPTQGAPTERPKEASADQDRSADKK